MAGYIMEFADHGAFDPEGRVSMRGKEVEEHNKALERIELDIWASQPHTAVAYVSAPSGHGRKVMTWLGTELGMIKASAIHRTGFHGSRIEHIEVRGTNGARYYGAYGYDSGQLVRLRKYK
jgi:hypothetical protein